MQSTPGLAWAPVASVPTVLVPAALALAALALEVWEPASELELIHTNPHHNQNMRSRSRRTTLSPRSCPCSQNCSSTLVGWALV